MLTQREGSQPGNSSPEDAREAIDALEIFEVQETLLMPACAAHRSLLQSDKRQYSTSEM